MRAARVRAPGSSPSHLGPPKARIFGLVWARRAPADAHDARACGAHHEVTAAGGSSIIEFAGAAPRRPKTCPKRHTERARARFAAIHQLISSFRVRAGDPAGARITSISGTLAARRRRVGGLCRPRFLKASPLRLRQGLAAQGRGHRRGTLRCPN